jgi:mannosylglycoprotein endo-beta-mannosidase
MGRTHRVNLAWSLLFLRICLPCSVQVHKGWTACRRPANPSQGCAEGEQLVVRSLPVTALTVLLENQQIAGVEHIQLDDIYYSMNLALLPDIHEVGREYYTLLYQFDVAPLNTSSTDCQVDGLYTRERQTLRIDGVNYRANAWLDGYPLTELSPHAGAPGMFVRRNYDVTVGGRFNLLIEPPDHPGIPNTGQGGNHDLAQDGAVPQYMLGWDWCQAMPDRATGFYGSTTLEFSGPWAIQDPAIQTVRLQNCTLVKCSLVELRILARVEGGSMPAATLTVTAEWGEIWQVSITAKTEDIRIQVMVQQPENIQLWWPHGVGIKDFAHMHTLAFSLAVNGKVSDVKTIDVGFRTIETWLDQDLQGQRFRINGRDIYLVGGNWISTDQALRYSAYKQRYCDEISLHRYAGINLLRVWGGGTAERDLFYDCADRHGVLVFQEFWMTGDNNGRWAGRYSWPHDYEAYLANVEDTVKRLRRHPSLLFYGGCNECLAPRSSTWAPNPPRQIDDGIRMVLAVFDPGRFYIASSMGGVSRDGVYYR